MRTPRAVGTISQLARLAVDRDFLDDYSKLPKSVQGTVKMAIDKFAEHVHAGLVGRATIGLPIFAA